MFERNGVLVQRKFREYVIPTLLTTVAISLATVVDSVIVGNLLGEEALSAVGLSGPVIYCLNMIYFLFAVGGVTCASIAKGRRDEDAANRIFSLTFIAGIGVMSLLVAFLLAFMRPITHALAQGDASLEALAYAYLMPLSLVGPVMMLIMGMAQFVRTDGKPKISAWIALLANGVNLCLDYIFIKFLGMGIAGAAWSTVLGYVAGVFVLLPYLTSKERTFHFAWPGTRDIANVAVITRTGLPKALSQGFSFARTLTLNMLIMKTIGAEGIAAMTVCMNALMLTNMFVNGANDTLLPIVGTLYGERDYAGIGYVLRVGLRTTACACVAMLALFMLAPAEIGRLFGIVTQEGLAVLVPALRLYALSLPLFGLNVIAQNFFQTTGREKFASLIATLDGFVCVVGFALLLAPLGEHWLWLAFLLSEAATFGIVLAVSARVRKREGVEGFLLLKKERARGAQWDVTIAATEENAVGLSEQVVRFCRDNGADAGGANRMGVAVEEMAANIARYGRMEKKRGVVIDVLVRCVDDDLIVRLRDDGAYFDPTTYSPAESREFAVGGIDVVKRISSGISYARQLGFNTTVVTVPRTKLSHMANAAAT